MTKNSPIGVFDSGLGGISIWRGIHEKLPRESIVYLGDGLRCPYGERPQSEIQQFTFEAVQKLLKEQCKLIVIACNTATAMAIDDVRKRFTDIPIVGLEPAIKPAAIASKSGVVGVVATARSFQGRLYKHTSSLFQDRVRILESVGEGWVELVENNMEDSLEALPLVSRVIEPMIEAGADHIVLGCTHYPFLLKTIRKVIQNRDVRVVDSTEAVAKRTEELLGNASMLQDENQTPTFKFLSLLDDHYVEKLKAKAGI